MLGYGLGQQASFGADGMSLVAMREEIADKVGTRWMSRGLLGLAAGAGVTTGLSYAALRGAGTKRPFVGATIFGAGALAMGLATVWYSNRMARMLIVAPPKSHGALVEVAGQTAFATGFLLSAR